MNHAFGKDVYPRVGVAGIPRRGKVVAIIIGLGRKGRRHREVGERVHAVFRPRRYVWRGMKTWVVVRAVDRLLDGDLGEHADCFCHGRLKRTTERGVSQAMDWECLAECEELGLEGVSEADVMAAERPSVVHVAMEGCEGERQHSPDEWVIDDSDVVRDGQETSCPRLVVCPRFEEL